jgi:hypothetical protein
MRLRRFATVYLLLLVCLALVFLPGCGKKARATVKGKVSFMKQHLTAGTVSFIAADGRNGSSIIKSDGTYAVNDAPVGEVTITVTTPKRAPVPETKPPPGMKGMPKEFQPPDAEEPKAVRVVPAPEKYGKVETSTLKFSVQPGTQDHDIELTP